MIASLNSSMSRYTEGWPQYRRSYEHRPSPQDWRHAGNRHAALPRSPAVRNQSSAPMLALLASV
jgi:hypothetical protein